MSYTADYIRTPKVCRKGSQGGGKQEAETGGQHDKEKHE